MSENVVVIGAGMGGLTAAIRLARRGASVTLLEAGSSAGGLASGFEKEGLRFDGGPYILLDRAGLSWAFESVGLELEKLVTLLPIETVYEVRSPRHAPVVVHADLDTTATGFDRSWPGSGGRYVDFVRSTALIRARLEPLLYVSRPGIGTLLRTGAWRCLPFLLRSLGSVLRESGLRTPIVDALGIWTHVAGQQTKEAPSPLAFVPALIHGVGAYYPSGGIAAIAKALELSVREAGVVIRFRTKVRRIRCERGRAVGVETEDGELVPADAVVANAGGIGTYLEMVSATPERVRRRLRRLPLQSPGVCAYLAVTKSPEPPYLRFLLPGGEERCRLLISPSVVDSSCGLAREWPARLLSPMDHGRAERDGAAGQKAYLERILAEGWWREHVGESRIVDSRVPAEWGARYHLYRDSMNPVMTARFMRAGRLAHRSPHVRRLYLAGSSTHPGQWVSFCAISGILAADRLLEDLRC